MEGVERKTSEKQVVLWEFGIVADPGYGTERGSAGRSHAVQP